MKTVAESNLAFVCKALDEICREHGSNPPAKDAPFLIGWLTGVLKEERRKTQQREIRLTEAWARDSRDVLHAVVTEIDGVPHVVVDGETCRVDLVAYRLVPVPGLVRCGECGGEPGTGATLVDDKAATHRGTEGGWRWDGCSECAELNEGRKVA